MSLSHISMVLAAEARITKVLAHIDGQVTLKLLAMGCFTAHSSSNSRPHEDSRSLSEDIPSSQEWPKWHPRCSTYWLGPDSAWHLGQVLSGFHILELNPDTLRCTRNIFDFCIVAMSATGDECLGYFLIS